MKDRTPRIRTISGTVKKGYEPFERPNPVPWPVFAVALALIAWGTYTLLTTSEFADDTPTAMVSASGNADQSEADSQQKNLSSSGEKLFLTNCSTCHQTDASGLAGAVPPLKGSEFLHADPEVVASIVIRGVNGPIVVAGRSFDGRMPTFGNTLKNEEIAAITNYVHGKWGGESERQVSSSDVALLKSRYSPSLTPWRGGAELRAAFPDIEISSVGDNGGRSIRQEEESQ